MSNKQEKNITRQAKQWMRIAVEAGFDEGAVLLTATRFANGEQITGELIERAVRVLSGIKE